MNSLPKKFLIIIPAGLLIIAVLFLSQKKTQGELTEIPFTDVTADQSPSSKELPKKDEHTNTIIVVDIKGAVKKPGIYQTNADARVNDAIVLAGGFTKDADESQINLAQKVQDEMVIAVPTLHEDQTSVQAPVQPGSAEQKVRINQASQEELETLSGIGPSKANAIIQYREENGLFQTADELMEIPGIGEKTLDNIRESIQVP